MLRHQSEHSLHSLGTYVFYQKHAEGASGTAHRIGQHMLVLSSSETLLRLAPSRMLRQQSPDCLPPSLITLTRVPLPDSHLFNQASHRADEVDESELAYWDKAPPYSQPKPADTQEEEQFTKNLMDVMFSQWCHLEIEVRNHCKERYCTGERMKLMQDVHQIAANVFAQWEQLNNLTITCEAQRHKEVAKS
ncbi:hypothetical protein JVU11DRAFT_10655 [Chiua virens]|nr:hypothetical protein JVU11DRAFT_10655 [Chiua virens]